MHICKYYLYTYVYNTYIYIYTCMYIRIHINIFTLTWTDVHTYLHVWFEYILFCNHIHHRQRHIQLSWQFPNLRTLPPKSMKWVLSWRLSKRTWSTFLVGMKEVWRISVVCTNTHIYTYTCIPIHSESDSVWRVRVHCSPQKARSEGCTICNICTIALVLTQRVFLQIDCLQSRIACVGMEVHLVRM